MNTIDIILSLIVALIFMKFLKYLELEDGDNIETYIKRIYRTWMAYLVFLAIGFGAILFAVTENKVDFTTIVIITIVLLLIFAAVPILIGYVTLESIKNNFFTKSELSISSKIFILIVIGYSFWALLSITMSGINMFQIQSEEYRGIFNALVIFLDVVFFIPLLEIWIHKEKLKNMIKKEGPENA